MLLPVTLTGIVGEDEDADWLYRLHETDEFASLFAGNSFLIGASFMELIFIQEREFVAGPVNPLEVRTTRLRGSGRTPMHRQDDAFFWSTALPDDIDAHYGKWIGSYGESRLVKYEQFDDEPDDDVRREPISLGLAKGMMRHLTYNGESIILDAGLIPLPGGSKRRPIFQKHRKANTKFVLKVIRTATEADELAEAMNDRWGSGHVMTSGETTVVLSARILGTGKPQGFIKYRRRFSHHDETYTMEVDFVFVREDSREMGVGHALALAAGADAYSDVQALSMQYRSQGRSPGALSFRISADLESKGGEILCRYVAHHMNGAIERHLSESERGGLSIDEQDGYVEFDAGF